MSKNENIALYLSPEHACGYFKDRQAVSLVADPRADIATPTYSWLCNNGFRRSGDHVYRPHCPGCDSCIPIRIPVETFTPNRSQRRVLKRNQDLQIRITPAQYSDEAYRLYKTYLQSRHKGDGMDADDEQAFIRFLTGDHFNSRFVEFRLEQRLLAIAVVDFMPDSLSAVYTFFDPQESRRGPGTLAVLWQLAEARRRQLQWVYLGYWIEDSRKMSYKSAYRPNERLINDHWSRFDD